MWNTGSSILTTDLTHWQYALADPLSEPVTWLTPSSGWASERNATAGLQRNDHSIWTYLNPRGAVENIGDPALWLWSAHDFERGAPDDLWFRTTASVGRPAKPLAETVPEPSPIALLGLGLLGWAGWQRRGRH